MPRCACPAGAGPTHPHVRKLDCHQACLCGAVRSTALGGRGAAVPCCPMLPCTTTWPADSHSSPPPRLPPRRASRASLTASTLASGSCATGLSCPSSTRRWVGCSWLGVGGCRGRAPALCVSTKHSAGQWGHERSWGSTPAHASQGTARAYCCSIVGIVVCHSLNTATRPFSTTTKRD